MHASYANPAPAWPEAHCKNEHHREPPNKLINLKCKHMLFTIDSCFNIKFKYISWIFIVNFITKNGETINKEGE